jgi:hypothetical protein
MATLDPLTRRCDTKVYICQNVENTSLWFALPRRLTSTPADHAWCGHPGTCRLVLSYGIMRREQCRFSGLDRERRQSVRQEVGVKPLPPSQNENDGFD